MKKDKEIEIKLKYSDRKLLTNKIKELGGKKISEYNLVDEYFGFSGSTMSNSNYILRIRCKGSTCEFTFKGKCKDCNNVWERQEITSEVSNAFAAKKILEGIGLKSIRKNESRREMWQLKSCELVLIDFISPEKFSIAEIEGKNELLIRAAVSELGLLVEETGENVFLKLDEKKE